MTLIRQAAPQDADQIVAIWNPIIRETTITFTTQEKTPADIEQMIAVHDPVLVACADDIVLGFACYGPFRSGTGYAQTMELTIHLAPAARGQGLGHKLLAALEDTARQAGVHSLIAGISGDNQAALNFHTKAGFTKHVHLPQVGRKFDRWLDLVLMQKFL